MILNKITRYIRKKIMCRFNPEKYYRSIGVKLGEGTKIYSSQSDIFSSEPWCVSIGKNCLIAGGVKFLTHDGGMLILPKEKGGDFPLVGDIKAGDNVYFGLRCMIMPGVTIGDNVIIGAGSIVTKDIPSNCVVAGVPAKIICDLETYSQKVLNAKNGNDKRYYSDLEFMHSKNPLRKNPR